MRYLTISAFGSFLGLKGNRLIVSDKEGQKYETPLSRLRAIRIERNGVSLSSDLVMACSQRGIRIFFLDWRHISLATLSGAHQHGTVALRKAQFLGVSGNVGRCIAKEIISTKIRNQRVVLLYFGKYLKKTSLIEAQLLSESAGILNNLASILCDEEAEVLRWREWFMGIEGKAATLYWETLKNSGLLPSSFKHRTGRGALEITNAALNYGYTILQSYIWGALENAGFELFEGVLHTDRAGRASLVLDLMEEYRPWVVDRNIIKLRAQLEGLETLSTSVKQSIVSLIDETMKKSIYRKGKHLKLENVLQRQVYDLAAAFYLKKKYKGLKFKW